ncbi:MAG: flagellar motor switch protein FliM, partial [Planctomycetes bacterium]|nr:flagellar motor switch protein FliM [Planctomycetota bacterium]
MADVLSQSEVDALLQAVSGGDDAGELPDLSAAPAEAAPTSSAAKAAPIPLDKNLSIYDFRRPNRVSPEQMRALSSLHEQFARNLAVELTGVLRTVIDIQTSQAEQLTYQEFTMSLPNPTYITTLSCEPLSGEMIIEMNPTICFPFIDKLLGGGHTAAAAPERPFTDIESKLISQVMDNVIHHLQETWDPIAHLRLAVTDTETNPQIMQNVAPNEIVVLLTFEIRMSEGEAGGMLNLC